MWNCENIVKKISFFTTFFKSYIMPKVWRQTSVGNLWRIILIKKKNWNSRLFWVSFSFTRVFTNLTGKYNTCITSLITWKQNKNVVQGRSVRLNQSLCWTTRPKRLYYPNQLSTKCVDESFYSWLTVPPRHSRRAALNSPFSILNFLDSGRK